LFAPLIKASCALLLPVLALQEPSVLLFSHLSLSMYAHISFSFARACILHSLYTRTEKCLKEKKNNNNHHQLQETRLKTYYTKKNSALQIFPYSSEKVARNTDFVALATGTHF
jgi:hypothetical protein